MSRGRYDAMARRRYGDRRSLVDSIKTERGCTDCGYDQHAEALEFDHREPSTKRFVISTNLSRRWEDILSEIAKCDVRCANCHAIRTKANSHWRGSKPAPETPPTLWVAS